VPFASGARPERPHETLFWRGGDYKALLKGDWKLQVSERPKKDWLFDLKTDPTERTNLASNRPDIVAELKRELARIDAEQAKPIWPALLEAPIWIDKPLDQVVDPARDEYVYWAN
jgi:arylsulfatase A-like enzyme